MNNIIQFPGLLAIPAQLTEKIHGAKEAGLEVHVVAVVAVKGVSGFWGYTPYWDTQPRELMAWCAYELDRHAKLVAPDDPDPGPPEAA